MFGKSLQEEYGHLSRLRIHLCRSLLHCPRFCLDFWSSSGPELRHASPRHTVSPPNMPFVWTNISLWLAAASPVLLLSTKSSGRLRDVQLPTVSVTMSPSGILWSFPFFKASSKNAISSQTYNMAIYYPSSTNCAESSTFSLYTLYKVSPSTGISPPIDISQVHSEHLDVGRIFKHCQLRSFSLTKGKIMNQFSRQ